MHSHDGNVDSSHESHCATSHVACVCIYEQKRVSTFTSEQHYRLHAQGALQF